MNWLGITPQLAAAFFAGGLTFSGIGVLFYRAGLRKGLEMANMIWHVEHDEQPIPGKDTEPDPNFPTEA